jgi:hypothetical protein
MINHPPKRRRGERSFLYQYAKLRVSRATADQGQIRKTNPTRKRGKQANKIYITISFHAATRDHLNVKEIFLLKSSLLKEKGRCFLG